MAQVVQLLDAPSSYKDSRSEVGLELDEQAILFLLILRQIDRETERRLLSYSTTLYVGNLSFYTTEAQMYECKFYYKGMSSCQYFPHHRVQRREGASNGKSAKKDQPNQNSIIMGLDRNNKSPCGFAFVEYYLHSEAVACMRYISGTKLDERIIRCDLDPGYKEGRQFGRGKSGGQVRDEFRQEYDSGRGKLRAQSQLLTTRWMGSSTSGGRKTSRRTGSSAFPDAIRHVCLFGWRIGYGRSGCAKRGRHRVKGQEREK